MGLLWAIGDGNARSRLQILSPPAADLHRLLRNAAAPSEGFSAASLFCAATNATMKSRNEEL